MASLIYNLFKQKIADGTIDWDTAVIRAMLVTSGYTADADHDFVNSGPDANELSGTGYTRKTLTTRTVVLVDASDRAELRCDDSVVWSAINAGTAAAAVLYVQVGGDDTTPGDDILVAYIDSGGFPIVTNGGDLTIDWNNAGVIQLS